ncbi:MAG: divergent polysaccharide deacetylase family protein [Sulfitobacter sp.]
MAQGVLSGIALGAVFSIGAAGVISVLVPIQPSPAPQIGTAEGVAPPEAAVPQVEAIVTRDDDAALPDQPPVTPSAPLEQSLPIEPMPAAQSPQVATDLERPEKTALLNNSPATAPSEQAAPLAPRPVPLEVLESETADAAPQQPEPLPAQPSTRDIEELPAPDALPETQAAQIGETDPVLPNPQALAPMIPDGGADAEIAEQASAPALPVEDVEENEVITAVVPEAPATLPIPEASQEESQAPDEEIEISDLAPVDPAPIDQTPEEVTPLDPAPLPRIVETPGARVSDVPGARVVTLGNDARPRVGTPASSLIRSPSEAESAPIESINQTTPTDPSALPPVQRYAQPFQNPEGKPLMSIVLIDGGGDLDAAEIGLPALSSFPYPISFAVNASLPDAAERMARYRTEGFEVLAMLDLPEAAQPTDAEVSLAVTLNDLPEVVGVIEGTGEGVQSSRDVADQVTGILRASGHGLVTQSKGLNSMPKLAVKEGVPAAPVFRDFDSQGQTPRVIRRFLDQAAFKAGQEGGVIMLGRLRPETIEALLVWGLADRAGTVALAPVSALLLSQR